MRLIKICAILLLTFSYVLHSQNLPANKKSSDKKKLDKGELYLQVLHKNGKFYFEDDCRCEYGTLIFLKKGGRDFVEFEYCDTIYPEGSYIIKEEYVKLNELCIIGNTKKKKDLDTINIIKLKGTQKVYKIWRSNTDINSSGYFFVPKSDSHLYKYYKVNYDENQG